MTSFDPRAYWERRLSDHPDLEGVGCMGLGAGYNAWLYAAKRQVFLREVAPLRRWPGCSVLDVGSGVGVYVELWRLLGAAHITASDIAQGAVDRLARRYPGVACRLLDIGDELGPDLAGARFDAISAIDMLFHIVDDARYRRALANLSRLLAPGGALVISDAFMPGATVRMEHVVNRSAAETERALADAGLRIVRRRPFALFMNLPVKSRLLQRLWYRLLAPVARRPVLGQAVGGLLYPLEAALLARLGAGPSLDLAVCERAP